MADLIERDKVLKTIFNVMSDDKIIHKHRALNRNIKQIPKADIERHARWIFLPNLSSQFDKKYMCSECKNIISVYDEKYLTKYPYCNCGCKMAKL